MLLSMLLFLGTMILYGYILPFMISFDNDFIVWTGIILACAGLFGASRMIGFIIREITKPIENNKTTNQEP